MTRVLDDFLDLLAADDRWQSLGEVAASLGIGEKKALIIARFLARYGLIHYEAGGGRVRIDARVRELLPAPEEVTVVATPR